MTRKYYISWKPLYFGKGKCPLFLDCLKPHHLATMEKAAKHKNRTSALGVEGRLDLAVYALFPFPLIFDIEQMCFWNNCKKFTIKTKFLPLAKTFV